MNPVSLQCSSNMKGFLLNGILVLLLLLCAGDVERNPGPLHMTCKKCSFQTQMPSSFFKHQLVHSQDRQNKFLCPISETCVESFSKLSAFKSHIYRNHRTPGKPPINDNIQEKTLICKLGTCQMQFRTQDELKTHLRRQHLLKGQPVPCIYKNCATILKSINYFNVHMSRDHAEKEFQEEHFNPEVVVLSKNTPAADNAQELQEEDIDMERAGMTEEAETVISDDEFILTISKFYLKLETEFLIPESRIQAISEDIHTLLSISKLKQEKKIKDFLKTTTISEDEKENILSILADSDVLFEVHNSDSRSGLTKLHSSHFREKFVKENFLFIEPQLIDMRGVDTARKKVSAYTVPMRKTLTALLADKRCQDEVKMSFEGSENEPHILKDYTDGRLHKKSPDYRQEVISLFFYQDGFEVVVPIGSAKRKHKMLGFYYMLANLPPKYRTKLDMIQLAMLVKETDWKLPEVRQRCWDTLIAEITDLTEGKIMFDGKALSVSIKCFMGDNLGSHHIGGYVESFVASYFCRYCNISSIEFQRDPTELKPLRTPEQYDRTVAAIINEEHKEGIKFASELNKIPGFHVSSPGLPPCIHHDLSEGVINYDMPLMITSLIKAGWFTFKELNNMILRFSCKDPDSGDKPAQLPQKMKVLGGNAVQNWNFVRFFPAIIRDHLKDANHPAWKLYLDLRHLCDVICAPVITEDQVFYMRVITEGYLFDRKNMFPNTPLRPKHHYLLHYPQLTLELGPLIRYSTLRCESKHCPFKKMARSYGNYINLCYTLANKHQVKFAYILTDLFPSDIVYDKSELLKPQTFQPNLEVLLRNMNFSLEALELKVVVVSSIRYKTGHFLVIGEANRGTYSCSMYVGDIFCIIYDKGEIHFLVKRHLATYDEETGFYKINEDPYDAFVCLPLKKFADHMPLASYQGNRRGRFISLKYFLPFM